MHTFPDTFANGPNGPEPCWNERTETEIMEELEQLHTDALEKFEVLESPTPLETAFAGLANYLKRSAQQRLEAQPEPS